MVLKGSIFKSIVIVRGVAVLFFIFSYSLVFAQTDSSQIPRGRSILPIPFVAYSSDLGLQMGGILFIYNYGQNLFPQYKHKIYLNGSFYTSMAGSVKLTYDSGKAFHGMRVTAHTRFLHEEASAFYGFNGSESYVNNDWANTNSSTYQSKLFYAIRTNQFRFLADATINAWKQVKFVFGFSSWYVGMHEADAAFFKQLMPDKHIPITSEVLPLWNRYQQLGIIPSNELNGGTCQYLKLSLMRDTRDFEPNPQRGSRSELLFNVAPPLINQWEHAKLTLMHLHFFPLHKRLTLATRAVMQTTIAGHTPYYMQSFIHTAYGYSTMTGLGGSETMRGISQNRILADGVAFGTIELRWRTFNLMLRRSNVWIGLSMFADAGKAIKAIAIDRQMVQQRAAVTGINLSSVFTQYQSDNFHLSYGGGAKVGINETTILSGDVGWPLNNQDGNMSVYLGVDFMF